jgi:G patch domain-containing protein 1
MSAYRGKTQKDEVRDDEGRRRFHGAFTGGFSAGYFNSVGSQEGWEPATFQSSRENRAQGQTKGAQQRPEDFMDEEDGLLGRELQAQLPYDTLGEASKQLLRRQVEKEAVGSVIPAMGMVDELLAPTDVAVGKKLLQMMGWKEGVGVGSRQHRQRRKKKRKKGGGEEGGEEEEEEDEEDDFDSAALLPDHLRHDASLVQQGKIMFSRPTVGVTVLPTAKNDQYGLGFDPAKDAPEFNAFRLQQGGGGRGAGDDDRGVYRMGDVLGKGTSSRAGRRNVMGFALDEEEDDVYDSMGGGGGGGGGGEEGREEVVGKWERMSI